MNQEAQAICLIVAQVAQLRPALRPGDIARNVAKLYRLAASISQDTLLIDQTRQARKLACELQGEFILIPSRYLECECVLRLGNCQIGLSE